MPVARHNLTNFGTFRQIAEPPKRPAYGYERAMEGLVAAGAQNPSRPMCERGAYEVMAHKAGAID